MPPKKFKCKKEIQNSEKVYEFLTCEEIQAKEQKHKNHLTNLQDCLNYINESITVVRELDEKQLISNKWQDYVNCCPLPKAYKPPDIRSFMEKLKYFENISKETTFDWLLLINERSILTQNLFLTDLTRSFLKQKNNNSKFSWEYERCTEFCLQVLKSLDTFLDNIEEVAKCDSKKLSDIKKLRNVIMLEIEKFFNNFTYRILCSTESYMNSIDPITAEYSFQTEHFEMHIWCLKNVPIRLQQIEESHFIANLKSIKISLQIPIFIMQPNFSIRGLHLNFDHISEKAKSFLPDIREPTEISIAAQQDLIEVLTKEWLIQSDIQNRVRSELLEKLKEYQQFIEEQEEKENKRKKDENSKTKKSVKGNILKEPPNITDDMFPNITEEFLQEEQMQYENFKNTIYNPKSLHLDNDEINLKKYFILGGIYQLYQVEKPQHVDFDSYNMTWHYNDSELVVNENVQIPSNDKYSRRRSLRYKSTTTRNPSLKIEEELRDIKGPWFILSIQLPEYLCYWGEPIACQYEVTNTIKTNSTNGLKHELSSLTTKNVRQTEFTTNSLTNYPPFLKPQKGNLSDSIFQIKQPSQENFFRTSLSNIRLKSKNDEIQESAHDSDDVLNIPDFPLSSQLNKSEMSHLQRFIIPQMISSFKFPKEIQEDEWKAKKRKKKTKGGLLIRKISDTITEDIKENKWLFTSGPMQNNPERLIPLYSPVQPIRIIEHEENVASENIEEPKSFVELIKLLNFIKWQNKIKIRKILDLKAYKSKFPITNKRLEVIRNLKLEQKIREKTLRSPNILKSHRSEKKSIISKASESNILTTSLQETSSETYVTEIEHNDNAKECVGEKVRTYTYYHWTTQHILKSEYDRKKKTFVIQTDRLGYFGFAFKQYEHFPYKFWKLEPNKENPENEIIFTVDTQHVRCVISITENGYRGHVIEPTTRFVSKPKMYLIIEETKSDLKEFMKIFKEKNLNIFADKDACFYIENGYFSEKHLSTELHTYNCMTVHSTHIKFQYSPWNCLAKRRDIILKFLQYQDSEENTVEVRITPEESFFVQTSELCSDNVDLIKLNYTLTWRNLNTYSD